MHVKKRKFLKVLIPLLAVILVIGCAAGGTLAYLKAKATPVTNTFVAGDIGTLTLVENTSNSNVVTPGVNIAKNPVVIFSGNNVDAYVFVKVGDKSNGKEWTENNRTFSVGPDQEMKWTVADGWIKLDGADGVYYREAAVDTDAENVAETEKYGVVRDAAITVSPTITEEEIGSYEKSLTFTAYAIQKDGFESAAEAWAQVQK